MVSSRWQRASKETWEVGGDAKTDERKQPSTTTTRSTYICH